MECEPSSLLLTLPNDLMFYFVYTQRIKSILFSDIFMYVINISKENFR